MIIEIYPKLAEDMIGKSIPKPLSGTLSGHASGEPFDKLVYQLLKYNFPDSAFRQYEYLNDLYKLNPSVIGFEGRKKLFNSPTVLFLLSRGKQATEQWEINNLFEEKQNDTADILLVKDDFFEIIDIKTRNLDKKAQAPNIISAYKLANVCAIMLDNKKFDDFMIYYLQIDWQLEGKFLICKNVHFASLFKACPKNLYINWAAAMQIQFHVSDLEQNFNQDIESWARSYLKHFTNQAQKRADNMIEKFVKPFEKYII